MTHVAFSPWRVPTRSIIVRAAPISACRMDRVASTSTTTALSVSMRSLFEQVNTAGPFRAAVHWLAGSECDTNLGLAGLAAPNAFTHSLVPMAFMRSPSRVSGYSLTARGASWRSMALASHLAWALEFSLSTSAIPLGTLLAQGPARQWIRLASTANPAPPTGPSSRQRSTTPSKTSRSRSLSRNLPCRYFRIGRMVGHPAVEAEPAEPSVRQVQVNLVARPALRADAGEVADQQHPDDRLGIDRGASQVAGHLRECPFR